VLQGLAACGGVVLARTMVRDLSEKDQAARAMSLMHACSSIAPMLAPLIGGQVLWFFGWRAIFWVLAGIGALAWVAAWLRLPETLRPEYRQPLHLGAVLKRYGELAGHRAFMGYALTGAFQFAALFSFLSGSPFVFIERYGIEPRAFGLIFGAQVMFLTAASLTNARFVPSVGAQRMLRAAVIVPGIVGPMVLAMGLVEARTGAIGLWPFLPLFVLQIASNSFIGANAIAMALQRYPHMAGTASSLMGVMQFGIGALFGTIVGQTFDGTIVPMTTAMGVAGLLCFLSHRVLVGRRSWIRSN
jgi:DHA1 family bicyclomycin/chloramphenicol resistance-like MFS transporter